MAIFAIGFFMPEFPIYLFSEKIFGLTISAHQLNMMAANNSERSFGELIILFPVYCVAKVIKIYFIH